MKICSEKNFKYYYFIFSSLLVSFSPFSTNAAEFRIKKRHKLPQVMKLWKKTVTKELKGCKGKDF